MSAHALEHDKPSYTKKKHERCVAEKAEKELTGGNNHYTTYYNSNALTLLLLQQAIGESTLGPSFIATDSRNSRKLEAG